MAPAAVHIGPPPAFDPELAAALGALRARFPGELTLAHIPLLRKPNPGAPAPSNKQLRRGGAFEVTERLVPGLGTAPDVPLLICAPIGVTGPVAAVYHMHAGGMIIGDSRRGLPQFLRWAEELGFAVVSVEYRLAPETPHPGPVEDCYAGLVWTAEHAGELGIDSERIVVAGGSAGGGLAAAISLLARDNGGPALVGQLLSCPMLDDRVDTPSAWQLAGMDTWDRSAVLTGWTALLGSARGGTEVSPYAAPARATDVSGLPPAFIEVGAAETLRDEVVAYAKRIWQAGGGAELHVWTGAYHGFEVLVPQAAVSRQANAAKLNWLRRLLGPQH